MIGKVVLGKGLMQQIAKAEIGWEGSHAFPVVSLRDDSVVLGREGLACVLTLSVRVAALLECHLERVRCQNLPQVHESHVSYSMTYMSHVSYSVTYMSHVSCLLQIHVTMPESAKRYINTHPQV